MIVLSKSVMFPGTYPIDCLRMESCCDSISQYATAQGSTSKISSPSVTSSLCAIWLGSTTGTFCKNTFPKSVIEYWRENSWNSTRLNCRSQTNLLFISEIVFQPNPYSLKAISFNSVDFLGVSR